MFDGWEFDVSEVVGVGRDRGGGEGRVVDS